MLKGQKQADSLIAYKEDKEMCCMQRLEISKVFPIFHTFGFLKEHCQIPS